MIAHGEGWKIASASAEDDREFAGETWEPMMRGAFHPLGGLPEALLLDIDQFGLTGIGWKHADASGWDSRPRSMDFRALMDCKVLEIIV